MKKRKIAVCTPCPEVIHTQFAFDLMSAVWHHSMMNVRTDALVPLHRGAALLEVSRQSLAEDALRVEATHIMWLDSDMHFPNDVIGKLLEHDLDFVGANCSKRIEPVQPTAMDLDGNRIWPDPERGGLQEVSMLGFAVLLMKTDMLRKIPKPWFAAPWIPELGYHAGEDMYFCKKAMECGFKLWIDHDLSWEIQHVGSKGYSMIDCWQERVRSGDH